jgi:hypothetical protein
VSAAAADDLAMFHKPENGDGQDRKPGLGGPQGRNDLKPKRRRPAPVD